MFVCCVVSADNTQSGNSFRIPCTDIKTESNNIRAFDAPKIVCSTVISYNKISI